MNHSLNLRYSEIDQKTRHEQDTLGKDFIEKLKRLKEIRDSWEIFLVAP